MLTYCGLLDDFTARHHDVAITSLEGLNEQLILAALFGDRLAINDGYLLVHAALHEAVLEPARSPLRPLVESGFVKILTRNRGRLGALAEEMAQIGITSAQRLLATPAYAERLGPELERWSERLRSGAFDGFVRWPNLRLDDVFRSVAARALAAVRAAAPADSGALDRFAARLAETPARRTDWEDVADALLRAGELTPALHATLMQAAGEAYHYAWGCALGAGGDAVRVLTPSPRHLTGMSAALGALTGTPRPAVELLVPDFGFARRTVGERWERLAAMVLPGHEVHQRKRRFLALLEKYYVSDTVDEATMRAAADEYTSALSRHFSDPGVLPVVFDLGFLAMSTAAGTAVAGPAGTVVGLGIGLAGVASAHLGGPHFFWRLTAPAVHGWLRTADAPPAPAAASFQLEAAAIERHTRGAQPFR